jgi:hypothetical protein|tara:strand:+ start:505 stop:774 length:270 start_codon:yes stop_codon:yes gene_type:complete
MPKLYNTVTKVYQMVGPSDVNNPVYSTGPEAATPVVKGYKADATDGDNDGLVQDNTPFERPVGEDLTPEEQKTAVSSAPKPKKAKKSSK